MELSFKELNTQVQEKTPDFHNRRFGKQKKSEEFFLEALNQKIKRKIGMTSQMAMFRYDWIPKEFKGSKISKEKDNDFKNLRKMRYKSNGQHSLEGCIR